jgi:tetratricopeptide (TPR) repeat protein
MPRERTPKQALSDAAGAIARGQFRMAGEIIDQTLATDPPPEIAAELLTMAGVMASEKGTSSLAIQKFEQAIAQFDAAEQSNHIRLAEALSMLANELVQRDPMQARSHLLRSVEIYAAQNGSHLRDKKAAQQHIAAVGQLAMLAELEGDRSTARQYYQQGLTLCDQARIRSGRIRELMTEGLARIGAG